jgi:thiol-disulfide isomerase/thioredoxin
MKHNLLIILTSVLLIAGVGIGASYFKSATSKKALTINGNGGSTPAKTMEGDKLAGRESFYFAFNRDDYQRALDGDKIIFLDFYANWCPFCLAEAPEIAAGFDALESDQVIGFRVNYNDNETDATEKALARQFAISYQHTKVILRDGQEILRSGDTWTRTDFAREINKILPE